MSIVHFQLFIVHAQFRSQSDNTSSIKKEKKESTLKSHLSKKEYERYKKKISRDIKEGKTTEIKKDQKILSKDKKIISKDKANKKKSAKEKKGRNRLNKKKKGKEGESK